MATNEIPSNNLVESNNSLKCNKHIESNDPVKLNVHVETNGHNENCDGLNDKVFKEHLLRIMAKLQLKRKSLRTLWPKLDKQTGYNSQKMWELMCGNIVKKLKHVLLANDIMKNVDTAMQLSPTDWLLLDLILVNEDVNVIDCKITPDCLFELYELVKKYNVENLVGDQLAEAWINITLNYNTSDRQCSPMLLQSRWYQLKMLARNHVFRDDETLHTTKTEIFHSVAITYQKIITKPFPDWKILLKNRCVILPEHFLKIIKSKWKNIEANDMWYLKSYNVTSNTESNGSTECNPESSIHNNTLNWDEKIENILNEKSELCRSRVKENGSVERKEVFKKKSEKIDIDMKISDNRVELEYANERKSKKSVSERLITSDRQNYNDYADPKLTMDSVVYIKKIDVMQVLTHHGYRLVNDKKIVEDRPAYKSAYKRNDIEMFKNIPHTRCKTPDIQSKKPEIVRVEYTSWLLQKPKNPKYNPIKLRKNPDFNLSKKNVRLHFFNSHRNRELLKECKPLTVDLHRAFENKLINGTMYLKGIKSHQADIVKNDSYDRPLNARRTSKNNSADCIHK